VFELFYTRHFKGNAVYTVPTRALANDKFREWKALGWNVGIATGDYSFNTSAPLVVATLETQKSRILEGRCADLIVIDEYQLISDFRRGANYEVAIAAAGSGVQLLLLSGSVANRAEVAGWLERLGRRAVLVEHGERPVPLEEVFSEAVLREASFSERGVWGRLARKIVSLEMSPLLIFAPKRIEAEIIASRIAEAFKDEPAVEIPRGKLSRAGRKLGGLLKRGVAFHHSGLSAYQRCDLVEDMAKAGRLKVVVATTGLGAGVNFSMRSVIVADSEYEALGKVYKLRPDELLQMYGRAGRRGLDKVGYAVCLPAKPRFSDAKEIVLSRPDFLDWSAFLRIMDLAASGGKDHIAAANNFAKRLFAKEKIDLGFESARRNLSKRKNSSDGIRIEMQNSDMLWQRRTPNSICLLKDALFFDGKKWRNFLDVKKAVSLLKMGAVCGLPSGGYGVEVRIAGEISDGIFRLNKSLVAKLKPLLKNEDRAAVSKSGATLKTLRRRFLKYLPDLFSGAFAEFLEIKNGGLFAKLSVRNCAAKTFKDGAGKNLFNPPMREVLVKNAYDFEALSGGGSTSGSASTVAEMWLKFGLVDECFKPTMRGRIFSLFNSGEGLAVAAALEDKSYGIREIFYDMANLRAGARFGLSSKIRSPSSRLADICRIKYGICDVAGYLHKGIPAGYGEGASEIMRKLSAGAPFADFEDEFLRKGDITALYSVAWTVTIPHSCATSMARYATRIYAMSSVRIILRKTLCHKLLQLLLRRCAHCWNL
ncbi:MAG: hypothetical protein J6R08_04860, partial [Opitutales bacterium]|nr:hypothetical protein [Opitutales bacterium]